MSACLHVLDYLTKSNDNRFRQATPAKMLRRPLEPFEPPSHHLCTERAKPYQLEYAEICTIWRRLCPNLAMSNNPHNRFEKVPHLIDYTYSYATDPIRELVPLGTFGYRSGIGSPSPKWLATGK